MADNLFYIANIRLPTEKAHSIQIIKMCEAFANEGYTTELIVTNRRTNLPKDVFAYYDVPRVFTVSRVWCLDLVGWGKWGYRLELMSFTLGAVAKVLFKKGIFYTRDEPVALLLSLLGKRVVWEAHMGHYNLFTRCLIWLKVPLVVISGGLKAFYKERGAREDTIVVASDAVDLGRFIIETNAEEARQELGLEKPGPYVIYTGSVYPWKGVDTLKKALEHRTDLELMIVSDQSPARVPLYLKAADVLVLPNSGKEDISKFYTSPMKLFEYMAGGRPIVASDLPSIREIVDDSLVYFFEADNPASLEAAIDKALSEPAEALAKAGRAKGAVEEYSWDKRAQKINLFIARV